MTLPSACARSWGAPLPFVPGPFPVGLERACRRGCGCRGAGVRIPGVAAPSPPVVVAVVVLDPLPCRRPGAGAGAAVLEPMHLEPVPVVVPVVVLVVVCVLDSPPVTWSLEPVTGVLELEPWSPPWSAWSTRSAWSGLRRPGDPGDSGAGPRPGRRSWSSSSFRSSSSCQCSSVRPWRTAAGGPSHAGAVVVLVARAGRCARPRRGVASTMKGAAQGSRLGWA